MAIRFDATNEYAYRSLAGDEFAWNTRPWGVGVWFKPNTTISAYTPIYEIGAVTTARAQALCACLYTSPTLFFQRSGSSYLTDNALSFTFTAGEWYYTAFTRKTGVSYLAYDAWVRHYDDTSMTLIAHYDENLYDWSASATKIHLGAFDRSAADGGTTGTYAPISLAHYRMFAGSELTGPDWMDESLSSSPVFGSAWLNCNFGEDGSDDSGNGRDFTLTSGVSTEAGPTLGGGGGSIAPLAMVNSANIATPSLWLPSNRKFTY